MKIRVKFRKWGCMKFIGHLDMMRYFQKAVRRADIDIRYSEGYSAHQIMSFAAPLGVGITSDGEYFDIDVNTTESTEKSIAALNAQMVDGGRVAPALGQHIGHGLHGLRTGARGGGIVKIDHGRLLFNGQWTIDNGQ